MEKSHRLPRRASQARNMAIVFQRRKKRQRRRMVRTRLMKNRMPTTMTMFKERSPLNLARKRTKTRMLLKRDAFSGLQVLAPMFDVQISRILWRSLGALHTYSSKTTRRTESFDLVPRSQKTSRRFWKRRTLSLAAKCRPMRLLQEMRKSSSGSKSPPEETVETPIMAASSRAKGSREASLTRKAASLAGGRVVIGSSFHVNSCSALVLS
mmetsp:Transcript_21698/g.37353  ORF Transcript_21698/g.37353 Transcript_21698/m.37353 type:complete len:210 (+) Transcript_21698:493-1122(+)